MRMKPNGYLLLDTLVGLTMIAMLITMLAVTLGHQRKASRSLAATRTAVSLAEQVLTNLQVGHADFHITTDDEDYDGEPTRIDAAPLDGAHAPNQLAWVNVSVVYHGQVAVLTGLARTDAVEAYNRAMTGGKP